MQAMEEGWTGLGASSAAAEWVGATCALSDDVDLLCVGVEGEARSFYWESASARAGLGADGAVGFGLLHEAVAERREEVAPLVDRLTRRMPVRWLDSRRGPGPFFGGVAFPSPVEDAGTRSATQGIDWRGFPVSRWVLPRFLVWRRGAATFLSAFGRHEDEARSALASAELERLGEKASAHPEARLAGGSLTISGLDREAWRERVALALESIDERVLSKVVLARAVGLELTRGTHFDVEGALAALRQRRAGQLFLFHGRDGSAFLGATPETLCRITGRTLRTEALAGSATPDRAASLLDSVKDRHEHQLVVETIREGLEPLCERLAQAELPEVVALPNVAHLRTWMTARLAPEVGPAQVVEALHPTPAVGGRPAEAALRFLSAHEGLNRGWYAGAVGWLGHRRADLRVGLRSALVRGGSARLFVGAGLVEGSTADGEWRETEVKSVPLLHALGGAHAV